MTISPCLVCVVPILENESVVCLLNKGMTPCAVIRRHLLLPSLGHRVAPDGLVRRHMLLSSVGQ